MAADHRVALNAIARPRNWPPGPHETVHLPAVTTATLRTLRFGQKDYPVVLPNVRDPRLHLAAVIISIHVLGQIALGFRVSVPQILSAIVTSALIEVILTLRRTGQLVWPASAMLTGSGVALIFRVIGTERGEHWSWEGWYLFSLVAAVSLLTKYVIRYRGSHVFNPSNVGLVVAFLVLGSTRVEPLDFWWAPLDVWMLAVYIIILVGGLLITARLNLLAMAATFWVGLALGLGLLAYSGHCITAAWALEPVCGSHFWRVVVTSPELLVFLFFMITDPKTIPRGRLARLVFAFCLAVACTLLIAPQTTEFGAKVALLGGLVVVTSVRYLFDRLLPEVAFEPGRGDTLVKRMVAPGGSELGPRRTFVRGAALGSVVTLVAAAVVVAGAPARQTAQAAVVETPVEVETEAVPLPPVTIAAEVEGLNSEIANGGAGELAVALAEDLMIEGEAMRRADSSLLRAASDGQRMLAMERRVEVAATTGKFVVANYRFESLHLVVVFTDGSQGGASLAFEATGVLEHVTLDNDGLEVQRVETPFESVFVMRQGAGQRWLIVDELPPE
jgi:hypothetical protein